MYQPRHFKEDRLEVQHRLIEAHPLGLLIGHDTQGRLSANSVPFTLDAQGGDLGKLRAHMARANPQWKALRHETECLVVFHGAEAYVSPNWYPTKRDHGKVVPTWNYVTVHARGTPRVIEDPHWLRNQISALTTQQEANQQIPWTVDDAPEAFTTAMLRGIVGVEITLTELQGKWKVSQNRPAVDLRGVHSGLTAAGETLMAEEVRRHFPPR